MSDIHDLQDSQLGPVLLYGRSGTGKTTLIGTFPKPILILQFKETKRATRSITHLSKGEVKVLQIREWQDVEDVYWRLHKGGSGFKTVAWETLGGVQEIAIREVAGEGKISKQGWGEISGLIKTWTENYANLEDVQIVFSAHDRVMNKRSDDEDEDAEDGEITPEVGAATLPSVAKFINGLVQVIGNTFIRRREVQKDGKLVKKTEFRLRIGPHPFYTTKIRTPKGTKVPQSVSNPSFEKLMQISRGEYTKDG